MRQTVLALGISMVLVGGSGKAAAAQWEFDGDHTNVDFTVRHMMVMDVRGTFDKVSGTLDLNEADVTKSTVNVTIDAASIDTRIEKRDNHVRSPDFLDVAKYPTITFKSTKVEKAGQQLKVTGDLTIRGVTKPVVLMVDGPTKPVKDPWGGSRIAIVATGKINREDFGASWNKPVDGGGLLVGKELTIAISAELMPKVETAKR